MKISVLVVSYNVRDLLARCLASVRDADEVIDVIVVDNASTDGSVELVREQFPAVRLIASSENRGFSWAVNAAAAQAQGDAYLLLNPDTEVPAGGIASMREALRLHPDVWAFGFRQVDEEGRYQLAMGLWPTLPAEFLRQKVQRGIDRKSRWMGPLVDRLVRRPTRVAWVSGASLLVRRQAFERVSGFDERFFLYFEDIDFCLRLGALGGHIYYDPTVSVLHHRGMSTRTASAASERAYRESQLLFSRLHHGPLSRWLLRTYLRCR